MNGWDEQESGELDMIADAARTYPLVEVPPGLAPAIILRIKSATPRPRFELKWIDVALGVFGASMTGLIWLLWQWLQNWPDWMNSLMPNSLITFDSTALAVGAIGVAGGLLVMTVCLLLALVVLAPRPIVRLEPLAR